MRAPRLALAACAALLGCTRPPPDQGPRDAALPASASAPPAPPPTAAPSDEPIGCDLEHTAAPKAPVAHLYGTRTTLPLTRAGHGVDGALRLLEDTRVRKPDAERPPITRAEEGWLHARLELLDPAGKPVDARTLWTTLAEVRPAGDLRGAFFLTLDPECVASRWCGPETQLVEVTSGKITDVTCLDEASGRVAPIRLRSSIPEGFRVLPAERGGGFEIFEVKVAFGDAVTAYVRYSREGERWVKRYKQRRGEDPPGNPGNEEKAFERGKFPALPPG
jgi:hypothetical protein